MPPHEGLVHQQQYDWRDSNVEFIGTEIDHKVKYNSAATEPAWLGVGEAPGLKVWRIESFEVVAWPESSYGDFYEGDSYIVLHSYKVGTKNGHERLAHDIFFWLGNSTTQDEAGTAAYKTVELDEFLHGIATQHRELQIDPSDDFVALFPRIRILSGGVRSGFTHVEAEEPGEKLTLLRIFKHPSAKKADSIMVHEVAPTWKSLDANDVFVLDRNDKVLVWQGKNCSPMEKAKAAQVVHDMTMAKRVDVEVLSQTESRSRTVVNILGGEDAQEPFECRRPVGSHTARRPRKLWRLSDASGEPDFSMVREGTGMSEADLDGNDVFLLDTGGSIWVWIGAQASRAERTLWLKVAERYCKVAGAQESSRETYLSPVAKVAQGAESAAFVRALEA
ncbi:putative actin-binding protein Fragmin [Xylariaceae sp. FL1019]|nr:putative actin-binding protein Fragmin [Xylariaceae sp. FL1019]